MKLKRGVIKEKYFSQINAMYDVKEHDPKAALYNET